MSSYHQQQEGNSIRFITCHTCGKDVPFGNLLMHQLRACSEIDQTRRENNQRHVSTDIPGLQNDSMDVDVPHLGALPVIAMDDPEVIITSIDDSSIDDCSTTSDVQVVQGPTAGRLRNGDDEASLWQSPRSQHDDPPSPSRGMRRHRGVEVVDLVDSPVPPSVSSPAMLFGQVASQWVCPVCTLHNPASVQQCDACDSRNPDRTVCPTQTGHPMETHSFTTSPLPRFFGGGVLMGGNLGVSGSLIYGRDPLASPMEGAVSGAFLNEAVSPRHVSGGAHVYRHDARGSPNHMGLAQARTSGGMSGGYPSMGENFSENTHGRTRPRSSFRVDSALDQDGSIVTVVTGGRSSTTIRQSQLPIRMNGHMQQYLLHAMLEEHTGRDADLERMGYDELLETFGDGTENLGATEGQIDSLPIQVVKDPKKELPEDARCCLICLDDIEEGDMRKILPCMHGFHAHCCDKWLKTNGSCPICKHRI